VDKKPYQRRVKRPGLPPGRRLDLSFDLTEEWLELLVDCPECMTYRADYAERIAGHLTEAHGYSTAEARKAMLDWATDHLSDENGHPMFECDDHGQYTGTTCPGCDHIDRAIDRAKEDRP
jgi:hypothetical protein